MIYEKEINGVKFTLVCETWTDRTSWGHKVTLYKNNSLLVESYKVRYYNRTWESYQYQSAIKGVIYKVMQALETAVKQAFKTLHGYKVITKKRAEEFAAYLKQDRTYNMYNELYGMF